MTSSSQAWKRPKSPSAGARSLISHLQPGQKIVPAAMQPDPMAMILVIGPRLEWPLRSFTCYHPPFQFTPVRRLVEMFSCAVGNVPQCLRMAECSGVGGRCADQEIKLQLYFRGTRSPSAHRRYTNISKPRDWTLRNPPQSERDSPDGTLAPIFLRELVGRNVVIDHVRRFHAQLRQSGQ